MGYKQEPMRRLLPWLGLIILLSGCVPNRKLLFLQKGDVNKKHLPKDTVLRVHPLTIEEYKIQPLDILSVTFETLSEENDEFDFLDKLSPSMSSGGGNAQNSALAGIVVNVKGEIEYAVLGKIKVKGLTIFEAQDSIRAVASKFVHDVVVRVRLLNFRYTVLGEVKGEKTVTSTNSRLNMMEAIGLAGGLTELADRANVKVVRQRETEVEIFYVDLLKEEMVESPFYFVQQNDIIVVPPLRQRSFRMYFITNLSIITSVISFGLLIYTLTQL